MTDGIDLWDMRELYAGKEPSLVLIQGEDRIKIELVHVKGTVVALADAAADLAQLLASGGRYHA